ncbi:MAG: hypothetical protein FVQ77_07845 [Cytophagales bacterium]|nr:hypothetical protein [Cytophagales bacterium]
MEIFGFSITLLTIVLAWMTWNNGRLMKETVKTINQQGEKRHKEVLDWFKKIDEREEKRDEREEKRDERVEQRHIEVLDWFKKIDEREENREERAEQKHREVIAITQQPHK